MTAAHLLQGIGGVLGSAEASVLAHLLLMVALSVIYAKCREIVILPAVMLASIIGVLLGLKVHPFILGMANFAAALIVFIAGLELDPAFIRRNKERALMIFFYEAVLLLSIFYALSSFLGLTVAAAITAIMTASNEAFIVEVHKVLGVGENGAAPGGSGDLAQYGITLSVLEDALAVMLLSIGFFANPSLREKIPTLEVLVVSSALLVPVLFLVSRLFNALLRSIDKVETKTLIVILYLASLIALADLLSLPEAIPIFIGAITLSFHGLDKGTFRMIESYYILALVGFVASLPHLICEQTGAQLTMDLFIKTALIGTVLAVVVFVLRCLIVFTACILGGLDPDSALILALPLANTGEFGLVVLAALASGGRLPTTIAFAALFAYAINLTMVSEITKRLNSVKTVLLGSLPSSIRGLLVRISRESDSLVRYLESDVRLKESIIKISVAVAAVYLAEALHGAAGASPLLSYFSALMLLAAFIVAVEEAFESFSDVALRMPEEAREVSVSLMRSIMTLMILYVVIAPLLRFLSAFIASGESRILVIPLDSPLSLLILISLVLLLRRLARLLARIVVS